MKLAYASLRFGLTCAPLLSLTACPDREISKLTPDQDQVENKRVDLNINRDLDILFVIDNSDSMKDEQESLARNFPKFMDVLGRIEGGLPNVHIGVVSSDAGNSFDDRFCTKTGDAGRLRMGKSNSCPGVNGNFLASSTNPDGSFTRNFTSTIEAAFSCQAALGTEGCAFEQHLESMKLALTPTNTFNAEFLRDNAFLAVVFIADEDDCSADPSLFAYTNNDPTRDRQGDTTLGPFDSFRCFEHAIVCDTPDDRQVGAHSNCRPDENSPYMKSVNDYVAHLVNLKGGREDRVIVAGILAQHDNDLPADTVVVGRKQTNNGSSTISIPSVQPSCIGPGQEQGARAALRTTAFLESFPDSTIASICQSELAGALERIGEQIIEAIGSRCLNGDLADRDPATPALEPDCQFSLLQQPNQADPGEIVLPQCTGSNMPCWRLEEDLAHCPATPTKLAVVIDDAQSRPATTVLSGQCVIE